MGGAELAQSCGGAVVVVVVVVDVEVVDVEVDVGGVVVVVVGGEECHRYASTASSIKPTFGATWHCPRSCSKMLQLALVWAASTAATGGVGVEHAPERLYDAKAAEHAGVWSEEVAPGAAALGAKVGAGFGPLWPRRTTIGSMTTRTPPKGTSPSRQPLPRRGCFAAADARACFGPVVRACRGPGTLFLPGPLTLQ